MHTISTTIKLLSTFLQQRTVNDYVRPIFDLESVVPQWSALEPTLYSLYFNNTPQSEPNNLTIIFDNDVTQIITTDKTKIKRLCNRTLTLRTQREIEKQNQYKREWKSKPI